MMLGAGLVTSVITFIRGDSIIYKLASLLIVFLIFNSRQEMIEDEVIEKDADGDVIGQVDQTSEGE